MMQIDIRPEDNVQERIDSSQAGDIIRFQGTFHLDEPLIFWNGRAYYGWGSLFFVKKVAIQCKQRPGEREHANKLARWLENALYFPSRAEPLSYGEIDEETTIYHDGELIVDRGEILAPLPTTPWHFYAKRWLARQLLRIIHRVFWFPPGTLMDGFYIIGDTPHDVSQIALSHEQRTAFEMMQEN